jgi:hypothetical protein
MSPRLLAVTLCLAAAAAGCGGARSEPRAASDGKAPTTLAPTTTTTLSVLPPPTVGDASVAEADAATKAFQALAGPRSDAVQFSTRGMGGHTEVRWEPATSTLYYSSQENGGPLEEWNRRPSKAEWARFWKVIDATGAWGWKADYGTATHTDCGEWRLFLQHDGKTVSSRGCSVGPDDASFRQVMDALTRLHGDAPARPGSRKRPAAP